MASRRSSLASRKSITGSLFSGAAHRLSLLSKPVMEIHIDNHYQSKVYSTASPVTGHVNIKCSTDTRFDRIHILLLGSARSRIDGVNIPQITEHTFLKLEMPIPASTYPVPRVLEANATYKIPFTFVIPQALTTNACSHPVAHGSVHAHHTQLPPSMGSWAKDDMAPAMVHVEYAVRARLFRDEATQSAKIFEVAHPINVLPQTDEDAPLSISAADTIYAMEKTKVLRKNIISPKIGTVTASATQPPALMVGADGRTAAETEVALDLQFEPLSAEALPPKVLVTASKITAYSFWSASGMATHANLGDGLRFSTDGRGSFPTSVALSTASATETSWKHHVGGPTRRDSGYCSENNSDSDGGKKAGKNTAKKSPPIYHSTRVKVPVTLPTDKKTFIPTFHSCIVSRVYVMTLNITITSTNGATIHIHLSVPLQIGVIPPAQTPAVDDEPLPSFEAAVEHREVDEFLRPRIIGTPTVDFARDSPPGYFDVQHHARPVATQ